MRSSYVHRILIFTVVIMASLSFFGCSKGLSGKYADGGMELEFKSNDKAYFTFMDNTVEVTYEVDGDKLILNTGSENSVFTINEDGTIGGPMGITLKKVS